MFKKQMGRRGFLQVAGAWAAAGAIPTAGGLSSLIVRPRQQLRVGVLLPTEGAEARLGLALLEGLRRGFADTAQDPVVIRPEFVTRPVLNGYGGAWRGASGLVTEEGAHVVVAAVTSVAARNLQSVAAARRVPVVVANVGAHMVHRGESDIRYVMHHSLSHWRASFALGRWAATNIGKRVAVIASEADAGYDSAAAFRLGVQAAGGTVVAYDVTPVHPTSTQLTRAFRRAVVARPDFIHAMYAGDDAVTFVRAYRAGVARSIRLTGTSFLVAPDVLRRLGYAANGIFTCSPGAATDATAGATPADPYLTLGFDVAQLITAGTRRAERLGLGTAGIVSALRGRTVAVSGRSLVVDPAANVVLSPLVIRRVQRVAVGFAAVRLGGAGAVGAEPESLATLAREHSVWLNEYAIA